MRCWFYQKHHGWGRIAGLNRFGREKQTLFIQVSAPNLLKSSHTILWFPPKEALHFLLWSGLPVSRDRNIDSIHTNNTLFILPPARIPSHRPYTITCKGLKVTSTKHHTYFLSLLYTLCSICMEACWSRSMYKDKAPT